MFQKNSKIHRKQLFKEEESIKVLIILCLIENI